MQDKSVILHGEMDKKRHPSITRDVQLDHLRQQCADSLQQVLAVSREVEQQLSRLHLGQEQEQEFLVHWRRHYVAWNEYAVLTRRLASLLRGQLPG